MKSSLSFEKKKESFKDQKLFAYANQQLAHLNNFEDLNFTDIKKCFNCFKICMIFNDLGDQHLLKIKNRLFKNFRKLMFVFQE